MALNRKTWLNKPTDILLWKAPGMMPGAFFMFFSEKTVNNLDAIQKHCLFAFNKSIK
jgi:hypothetical protein